MGELKDILVNVGAVAGVAAIVGLAVLAMLYFSQARDVRRLREWAGREPERAAEVELRAAQIASQAIAQAYESMAMRQSEAEAAAAIAREQGVEVADGVIAAEPPVTGEHPEPIVSGMEGAVDSPEHLEEIAADGVRAITGEHPEPVVSGMEGAVDSPEHVQELLAAGGEGNGRVSDEIGVPATATPGTAADGSGAVAADADRAAAEPASLEAPATPAAAQAAEAPAAGEAAQAGPPAEGTAPPAGAASSTGEVRPSRLAPSTPAAGRVPLPPLPPLDTSEFLAVNRPLPNVPPDFYASAESAGAGAYESRGRAPERRPSRAPVIVAGVLVALFAIVLAATQLGGSNEPDKISEQRRARDERTISTSPRSPEVNRPAVGISVLNGTQTAGLAKIVSDQLNSAGFTDTTFGNRNDGVNHATSTVFYAEGSKLEAREVAKELTIDTVKPMSDEIRAIAGGTPVVVELGADIEQ